jgi:hypothetical protein
MSSYRTGILLHEVTFSISVKQTYANYRQSWNYFSFVEAACQESYNTMATLWLIHIIIQNRDTTTRSTKQRLAYPWSRPMPIIDRAATILRLCKQHVKECISEMPCTSQKVCGAMRWTVEGDGHTNFGIPSSMPDKTALREEPCQPNRGTAARGSHP